MSGIHLPVDRKPQSTKLPPKLYAQCPDLTPTQPESTLSCSLHNTSVSVDAESTNSAPGFIAGIAKSAKRSGSTPQIQSDTPNKKRLCKSSSLYDTIITIDVGTPKTEFPVYRGKLCHVSPFFAAIFRTQKKPDSTATYRLTETAGNLSLHLQDENPNLFRRFVSWLYEKNICLENESEKNVLWNTLIEVFLFSIRWDIPLLQNKVLDVAVEKFNNGAPLPKPRDVNKLYGIHEKDFLVLPLRKLLVDVFAVGSVDFGKSLHFDICSPHFLSALVKRLKTLKIDSDSELQSIKEARARRRGETGEIDAQQRLRAEDYYYRGQSHPIVLDA